MRGSNHFCRIIGQGRGRTGEAERKCSSVFEPVRARAFPAYSPQSRALTSQRRRAATKKEEPQKAQKAQKINHRSSYVPYVPFVANFPPVFSNRNTGAIQAEPSECLATIQ